MSSNTDLCVPCSCGMNLDNLIADDQLLPRIEEVIPMWTLHERKCRGDATNITDSSTGSSSSTARSVSINRKFTTKNFQSAMDCVVAIGRLAEELNHHPDLHITNYRDVHVEIYTHTRNGVTENDIQLAHAIDTKVMIEYSPKWLNSNPIASQTSKMS